MHCLESVYSKKIFNLEKIFILRQFKTAANQTECFRTEQRPVINFFMLKSSKPVEFTEKFLKHILQKEMFADWLNMGLPLWAWVEKIVDGIETHWLSGLSTRSSQKRRTFIPGHKRTNHNWKRCTYKQYFGVCPWCSRYRRRNWTRRHEFKSWTRLIAFHIGPNTLGKGMNPIILPPAMGK